MSGFDQLERQLLDAVAAHARTSNKSAHTRVRSRLRSRRALAGALVPLVIAAAAAAAVIASRPSETVAQRLLSRVLAATKHTAACRFGGFRHAVLSDMAPSPGITATIPQLAVVPHGSPPVAALRLAEEQGGTILVHTIRQISFPGDIRLVMFVDVGRYPFEAINPAGCVVARLDALRQLRPKPSQTVRASVDHLIEADLSTRPGVQTFALETIPSGRTGAPQYGSGAGAGIPVAPDATLPTGIVSQASACGRGGSDHTPRCTPTLYLGIAIPGTARVRIEPARRGELGTPTEVAPVRDGVFAFTLPRRAGQIVVTQQTSTGRALSREAFPLVAPARTPAIGATK
jgi:hypothetical protein